MSTSYLYNSSITNHKCSVLIVLPSGSPARNANQISVEVYGFSNGVQNNIVFNSPSNFVVVQPTSSSPGSITINNIPLTNGSGNSIKVKYYNSSNFEIATSVEVLTVTGTYVNKYDN